MGFDVRISPETVKVTLSGLDWAVNLRRSVAFDRPAITGARIATRSELEALIDHRVLGFGTHDGRKRPNRRRVGTMLGRGISGKQFWAVPAGPESAVLLVLDVHDGDLMRAVLAVDDPESAAAAI